MSLIGLCEHLYLHIQHMYVDLFVSLHQNALKVYPTFQMLMSVNKVLMTVMRIQIVLILLAALNVFVMLATSRMRLSA